MLFPPMGLAIGIHIMGGGPIGPICPIGPIKGIIIGPPGPIKGIIIGPPGPIGGGMPIGLPGPAGKLGFIACGNTIGDFPRLSTSCLDTIVGVISFSSAIPFGASGSGSGSCVVLF